MRLNNATSTGINVVLSNPPRKLSRRIAHSRVAFSRQLMLNISALHLAAATATNYLPTDKATAKEYLNPIPFLRILISSCDQTSADCDL